MGRPENPLREVRNLCITNEIQMELSPAFATQSNGTAERFMQELGMRVRDLLFTCQLPTAFWAEALIHASWCRNRLPSESVNGQIPILL